MAVQPGERPQRAPDVVWRAADESTVLLLNPADGQYFTLDEVGARIWDLVDGTRSAAEIAETVAAEYDADPATIHADVLELLAELRDEGLVDLR